MELNIGKEVARMQKMTVPELRVRYAEVFGEESVNTTRILQRATGSISPVESCSAHNPCSLILSKTCVYRMIDASHTMLRIVREMSDYRYGHLDEHPSRRSRRWDEQARGLPEVQLEFSDDSEDSVPRVATWLLPDGGARQTDNRALHFDPSRDSGGRQTGPQEAASHGQANL